MKKNVVLFWIQFIFLITAVILTIMNVWSRYYSNKVKHQGEIILLHLMICSLDNHSDCSKETEIQ